MKKIRVLPKKIKKYKDNKDTMGIIESAKLYEDLVNEAMNIFGYKWDDYFKEWEN